MMKKLISVFIIIAIIIPSHAYAQKSGSKDRKKLVISGMVTSLDKKPVAGVEIFIDSIPTGIVTDNLGQYKIRIQPGVKKIIAFSREFGYSESDINDQSTINLSLNPRITDLPGFITNNYKGNKSLTKPSKPKKINTYTDIYQMIRQEVPGVVVSGRSIVVQGPNSFFGSTTPLFIVNGVRVNSIDNINPVEVKSIELLKGSNAAIYGTEGANGVISITLINRSEK